jgi:hypothetical protein
MAGKCVLVTGGTGGIGKATAAGLAGVGARVGITGRDRARADAAANEIRASGGSGVDVFVADISSQAEVARSREAKRGNVPGGRSVHPGKDNVLKDNDREGEQSYGEGPHRARNVAGRVYCRAERRP